MIVITTTGARTVRDADDFRLLNVLAVAIATAVAHARGEDDRVTFPEWAGASAISYLRELDPPRSDSDAVVWAWTDTPAASRHVTIPTAAPAQPAVMGRDGSGRFVRVA